MTRLLDKKKKILNTNLTVKYNKHTSLTQGIKYIFPGVGDIREQKKALRKNYKFSKFKKQLIE